MLTVGLEVGSAHRCAKAIFIKKEQVAEKWIIRAGMTVIENNVAYRLICLEISEIISLKIDSVHLWMFAYK
jgi:hypothetical protein